MNVTWPRALWLVMLFRGALATTAELAVVPDPEPQLLFSGDCRPVAVVIHNAGELTFEGVITARLFQVTSATAARLSEVPVKELRILPGQTVVEAAQLSFPDVKTETGFLVQWLEDGQRVSGTTEVRVFPTNLLARLRTLAGETPLGVFDPANQLKPLLRALASEFQDLIACGTDKFTGKLAVFGPFPANTPMRNSLTDDIRTLAKRGVAVVWLQPPPAGHAPLRPSFYTVRVGRGTVVVAQSSLVSHLPESPEAQLNLWRLAELALHPFAFDLPETGTSN